MRFHGLSEPQPPRVCTAEQIEQQAGLGFLGSYRKHDPLVELSPLAISDDDEHVMVQVHVAGRNSTFLATAIVSLKWFSQLFEEYALIRGIPDDPRDLEATPCQFFEDGRPKRTRGPSVIELVRKDEYGFARHLGFRWLHGRRPVRKTEQLFITLLEHDTEEVRDLARKGLLLLVDALAQPSITPSAKRKIGEVCIAIGRFGAPHSDQED